MKTILRIMPVLLVVCMAACGPNVGAPASDVPLGPEAWIDAPLDNSNLPLATYQVVSHASDLGGVSAFELSVNGQVLSTDDVPGDQAGQIIAHISQPWLPPAPGTYLLEVRARNKAGAFGPVASANVSVGRVLPASPTVPASATVTITPTVTPTSTPTLTPTSSTAMAVGLQNTNCHTGPGGKYDVYGTLAKDQAVQINGVNAAMTWVQVQHPNFKGRSCWVSVAFVKIQGSLAGLPVLAAPPLPGAPEPGGPAVGPSETTAPPTPSHS